MKQKLLSILTIILIFIITISIQFSCNKTDELIVVPVLGVSLPLSDLNYDRYYGLSHDARSIELVFDDALNEETIEGNIVLFDKEESLALNYDLIVDGKVVFIRFHNDFFLNDGWKYELKMSSKLNSVEGIGFNEEKIIEFRTTAKHISYGFGNTNDTIQRTLIACISDIHCGDERATNGNYSWFGKNADALEKFLDFIKNNEKVKELVILGDLFDEWMVPYEFSPFDSAVNITSSKEYFHAIANSPTNKPVFDKMREIISEGEIDIIYVPGNHDMLITKDVIDEIIPGALWKGDATGLGKYNPVDKILMEHGHRYDFFNCPQPLVNDGHILPPGYFVSRLYAAGLAARKPQTMKQSQSTAGDAEFITAWTVAFGYTIGTFMMDVDTIPMDSNIVLMNGIDNYSSSVSFDGARDMYAANIEELWPNTQVINNVPIPLSVFLAIVNGTYLYGGVIYEFLLDFLAPNAPKIVAFGHSHQPELKVFPFEHYYTGIYANSGSWLDADQSKYKVRTFLIINPAEWSGSNLDVVSLYQYNPDSDTSGNGNTYKSVLLDEESIAVE